MTHDPHAVPHIQLSGISKAYPNGVEALQNIDLTLYQGEIFGIIGRSGAGKSTLLRLFNRLENADSGEITIHGEQTLRYSRSQMRDLRRRVAMIFQHFNLMSTKTVAENVEFALKMSGMKKQQYREIAREQLEKVRLEGLEDRRISQISGGQMQRVALARAFAVRPSVMLLDEPFSSLDGATVQRLLVEMRAILQQARQTALLVTHSLHEAQTLADQVFAMSEGGSLAPRRA